MALDVGIAHHDAAPFDLERHKLITQIAAINQQRVAELAEPGNELIHDAAIDADEAVFRPLAELRHLFAGHRKLKHLRHEKGRRDFNCGGTAKAGRARHVPFQHGVEPAQMMPVLQQFADNALDVIRPGILLDER